jgi:aryl-alcohol dehydrogenase-like predicted oxidoreductase
LKYQKLGRTGLEVSEVGFGVWTVSTGWWGKIEEPDAIRLMERALDLGINFFDTADTYGLGYGEEILPMAFKKRRSDIIIGTKFGYDFYTNREREGHTERPQKWDREFIKYACEQSLTRLQTDYIDLYQLHNPKMNALESDELFETLDELVKEGKIRHYAAAIGPDIGWFEEGEVSMRERNLDAIQIIYSVMEQQPARKFFPIAEECGTGLLSRVPHASGLLDGTFTKDTVFAPDDHRAHRKQAWLETGIKKLNAVSYLEEAMSSTPGQTAIKFVLSGPNVASVLPNILNMEQLEEFAAAPETDDIPQDVLERLHATFDEDFGLSLDTEGQEVAAAAAN